MPVKDIVARRFEELCREKNIKPNELAERAGVTPSTVYSMLNPPQAGRVRRHRQKAVRRPGDLAGHVLFRAGI